MIIKTIADMDIIRLWERVEKYLDKGYELIRIVQLGDGVYPSALLIKENKETQYG